MNFSGIIIGAAVFLSIGVCHPLVIKMEYYWGLKSWWIWLAAGLVFSAISLIVPNDLLSIIIGGFAFCCFWGIGEMFISGASARCSCRKRESFAAGSRKTPPATSTMRSEGILCPNNSTLSSEIILKISSSLRSQ